MKTDKPKVSKILLSILPAVCYIILSDIAYALPLYFPPSDDNPFARHYEFISQVLCLVISLLIGFSIFRKSDTINVKKIFDCKEFNILPPVMSALFLYAASQLIVLTLRAIVPAPEFSGDPSSENILLYLNSLPNYDIHRIHFIEDWQNIVFSLLLAPVAIELLFRYFAIKMPAKHFSIPVLCLANGLLFAFSGGNLSGMIFALIGGAAMALVFLKTEKLLYTIIAHALYNLTTLIPQLNYWFHENNQTGFTGIVWIAIQAVLLAIPVIWFFTSFRKRSTT